MCDDPVELDLNREMDRIMNNDKRFEERSEEAKQIYLTDPESFRELIAEVVYGLDDMGIRALMNAYNNTDELIFAEVYFARLKEELETLCESYAEDFV